MKCCKYYLRFFRVVEDGESCWLEMCLVAVCVTVNLKKPLREETLVFSRQSHKEDQQFCD